jgi:hypothetical protein
MSDKSHAERPPLAASLAGRRDHGRQNRLLRLDADWTVS